MYSYSEVTFFVHRWNLVTFSLSFFFAKRLRWGRVSHWILTRALRALPVCALFFSHSGRTFFHYKRRLTLFQLFFFSFLRNTNDLLSGCLFSAFHKELILVPVQVISLCVLKDFINCLLLKTTYLHCLESLFLFASSMWILFLL